MCVEMDLLGSCVVNNCATSVSLKMSTDLVVILFVAQRRNASHPCLRTKGIGYLGRRNKRT